MTLRDRMYGEIEIDSPVLLELMKSAPMQRLKGICQFGIPDKYYYRKNYYRFEHCVGVMILLKKLGASEEEQIAGLLHDVSHTAFSHLVDWVVGEGKTEDFQDDHHTTYIKSTVIPEILEKHGLSLERISDYHHFGLLERDTPELCADRVDYALREFPQEIALECFSHLTTADNKIVCNDEQSALLFARNYLKTQMEHWGSFETVSRYRLLANVLRHALNEEIISMEDFWKDDAFVLNKMEAIKDKDTKHILEMLSKKSLADLPKDEEIIYKKFRHVDPLFLQDGHTVRLSAINQNFKHELEAARTVNDQGLKIPKI